MGPQAVCSGINNAYKHPLISAFFASNFSLLAKNQGPRSGVQARRFAPALSGGVTAGGDLAPVTGPIGVKELAARLIDFFVGMRAEEIALRLE